MDVNYVVHARAVFDAGVRDIKRSEASKEGGSVVATIEREVAQPKQAVMRWLLDSDPSIRWQVLRDLAGEPEQRVTVERSRVAVEGWGARLLGLQQSDGNWGGGPWVRASWASTMETLMLLRELGLDPASAPARNAIALVRDNSNWGPYHGHAPFFEGESEPCINGRVLACGAYFGQASDRLVDRLLGEQLPDGGWNCDAPPSTKSSFNSTICVLEGLLEYEKANGAATTVTEARLRGQEYLLERKLFRSLTTGKVIDRDRKSQRRLERVSRFRRGGTTTSCGGWTICEERRHVPTRESQKRSNW